ncbi:hypothetical protein SUGI_0485290 [Cryptomeria japonica]|nr:hypothetical protein SUGI_0485290 [Cryptomeria japonica]
MSLVRFPQPVGIVPLNELEDSLPKDVGIVPLNELEDRSSTVSFDSLPKDVGIVPLNELEPSKRCMSFDSLPKDVGMVPLKELPNKSRYVKLTMLLISLGIWPIKLELDRLKYLNLLSLCNCKGMARGGKKAFPLRSKCSRWCRWNSPPRISFHDMNGHEEYSSVIQEALREEGLRSREMTWAVIGWQATPSHAQQLYPFHDCSVL